MKPLKIISAKIEKIAEHVSPCHEALIQKTLLKEYWVQQYSFHPLQSWPNVRNFLFMIEEYLLETI